MNKLAKNVAEYLKDRLNEWTAFFTGLMQPRQEMVELPVRQVSPGKRAEVATNFAVTPPPINAGEYAQRRRRGEA